MRKLTAFLLLVTLILGIAPAAFADELPAEETSGPPPLYVALGDSIASYYGLQKGEGYAELLCAALQDDFPGLTLKNLARPGDTTADLLKLIESSKAVISGAKIITVSIGANDFLMDALAPFSRAISLEVSYKAAAPEIAKVLASTTYNNKFQDNLTTMHANLIEIYTNLRAIAPDAKIYITNFYNPLPITDKQLFFPVEEYIMVANNALVSAGGFIPVDTFNAFFIAGGKNLSKFDFENGLVDPHPTKFGQRILAAVHAEKIAGTPRDIPEPAVQPLTRAEAIAEICDKLLADADAGLIKFPPITVDMTTYAPFSDVPDYHPQAIQIKLAAAIGLVVGVGGGKFLPDAVASPESLEQMQKNVERIFGAPKQ
ncbi:MAG: GDSL-type esterase/lipase family protein [Oscillospiraceae bacterium]|jgi:lysophospholipase L1-like esterase|nr:GDSL-type esterase/lipase family protein [Oscillospiraceae bacterium]